MSQIVTLFADLDGTGNNYHNDTKLKDGTRTNIAKLYDLYRALNLTMSYMRKGLAPLPWQKTLRQVRDGLAEPTSWESQG